MNTFIENQLESLETLANNRNSEVENNRNIVWQLESIMLTIGAVALGMLAILILAVFVMGFFVAWAKIGIVCFIVSCTFIGLMLLLLGFFTAHYLYEKKLTLLISAQNDAQTFLQTYKKLIYKDI